MYCLKICKYIQITMSYIYLTLYWYILQLVNQTMLSNRRAYSDLFVRLMSADIEREKSQYTIWKRRVEDWRQLNTKLAIEHFRWDQYISFEIVKLPVCWISPQFMIEIHFNRFGFYYLFAVILCKKRKLLIHLELRKFTTLW